MHTVPAGAGVNQVIFTGLTITKSLGTQSPVVVVFGLGLVGLRVYG